DVVLLDYQLGGGETGLDWLETFGREHRLPPTILMTATGSDYLAARAIKLGAWDYIRKQDVTTARIGAMVTAALGAGARNADETTLREERAQQDAPYLTILQQLIAAHPAPQAPGGQAIGYRFVRLIGQGASSRVYLAERISDGTTLVLKVIDLTAIQDIQLVERFIREAEIVARIDNPYVVHFHDYGLTRQYGYIAMEFFTRGDLKQRIERGVAVDDALNYVRHIARGLAAIHAAGIVHRDLKPGNIMFRADDSLALADFGIARRLDQTSNLTNHGSVLGTPNYLSPEQALGEPVDARADFYSTGVILFELLAARKPFRAESAAALVFQHVHAAIPRLPPARRAFQPLVERLLAKRPADRCQSAAELIELVDAL
ncbi:MAG: protein kinase, partial [Gammaproteobacteria bacterium]